MNKPILRLSPKILAPLRLITVVAVGIGIFFLGWGIGNGKIAFGADAAYRKSVQKNLPANLDYSGVEALYDKLRADFDGDLDQAKLLDGIRSGLAKAAGDPYTEYFNPKAAEQFNSDLNGSFTGIGAELSKDDKKNIVIVSPISGFPAEKAGLKPKDIIAEIDGSSAYDISVSDAVAKIRGAKGTQVKLTIVRSGEPKSFTITRDQITIPSVTSKTLDGNLGYLRISRFSEDTARLAQKAASEFKVAGVKGMVLDLRSNPGGLLESSVKVSGLWLPDGKTVLSERRGGEVIRTYKSDGPAMLAGVPTVVLIDEGSASASEITAGALKDNGVATLIGMKSFGKGSVQQLENLVDGGILKVTIARWYTPGGKNIDKEGIKPDTEVKISEDDAKNGRDPQLDAATLFLKK